VRLRWPKLGRLFVTTSSERLDLGAGPEAGALFTCTPGIRGVPVREAAG